MRVLVAAILAVSFFLTVCLVGNGCAPLEDCTVCGKQCCDNQTEACVNYLGLDQCFGKSDVPVLDAGR